MCDTWSFREMFLDLADAVKLEMIKYFQVSFCHFAMAATMEWINIFRCLPHIVILLRSYTAKRSGRQLSRLSSTSCRIRVHVAASLPLSER